MSAVLAIRPEVVCDWESAGFTTIPNLYGTFIPYLTLSAKPQIDVVPYKTIKNDHADVEKHLRFGASYIKCLTVHPHVLLCIILCILGRTHALNGTFFEWTCYTIFREIYIICLGNRNHHMIYAMQSLQQIEAYISYFKLWIRLFITNFRYNASYIRVLVNFNLCLFLHYFDFYKYRIFQMAYSLSNDVHWMAWFVARNRHNYGTFYVWFALVYSYYLGLLH